jgi:quercetin dioxygenase-like cupin family protein
MAGDIFQQFENGILVQAGQTTRVSLFAWNEHKNFAGVFLKNVVTTDQTTGLLSCHLVRIDPHCAIGLHTHPTSMELHEVVQGKGVCLIGQEEVAYVPGTVAIIACNTPHEVRAGAEGLCLFAKFITVPV